MEEQCLMICSLGLPSLLYYRSRITCPEMGTAHSGLNPRHQSSVKKMPLRPAAAQSYRGIFSIEILSFQMTLACVEVTIANS